MNSVIRDSGYTALHASVARAFQGQCRLVRESGDVTLSFRSPLLPGGSSTDGFIQAARTAGLEAEEVNETLHVRSDNIKHIADFVMKFTTRTTESPTPVLGNKVPVTV